VNLFRTRSLNLALLAALTLALPLAHATDEPSKKNFFLHKSPRATAYVPGVCPARNWSKRWRVF